MIIGMWLLLRFHVPREGEMSVQIPTQGWDWSMIATLGLSFCGFILVVGSRRLPFNEATSVAIGFIVLLAGFVVAVFDIRKVESRRKLLDEKASREAPELWDRG